MHAVLVHNPTAGSGSHTAEALTALLREAGYSVTAYSTKECVYKEALKEHADLVLTGGDGAVGRVIRYLPHHNTPVAILPLGTANNVARTLGIEGDADRLIECVRKHVTRSLDIGIVSGPWGRRRFVEGVGVGLLADWMSGGNNKPPAAERTKIGRDRLREALVNAVPKLWNLSVDGHNLVEEVLFLEVLNTRFIGPALPLGPSSAPGDQLLDVVYLLPEKRSEMLSWLDSPEGNTAPLIVRQRRKVILQWYGGHLHIDDRVQPTPERLAQVKIKLEPTSLRICAPTSEPSAPDSA
jgi:diacylglycerol kinase (ATP)